MVPTTGTQGRRRWDLTVPRRYTIPMSRSGPGSWTAPVAGSSKRLSATRITRGDPLYRSRKLPALQPSVLTTTPPPSSAVCSPPVPLTGRSMRRGRSTKASAISTPLGCTKTESAVARRAQRRLPGWEGTRRPGMAPTPGPSGVKRSSRGTPPTCRGPELADQEELQTRRRVPLVQELPAPHPPRGRRLQLGPTRHPHR